MSPFLVIIFGNVLSITSKLNLLVSLHKEVCIDLNFIYISLSLSSLCVSVITVCFRHHFVFPSSLCVSVITLCFSHHFVFQSSLCVSVITLCFSHHFLFPSSLCVSVITLCFRHHFVFPSSLCISVIILCFCHHFVFPSSLCVSDGVSLSLLYIYLYGVSNVRFRPCCFMNINKIMCPHDS